MFKGKLSGQSLGRSGLEFLSIALIATGLGYAVGFLLERFTGTPLPVGGLKLAICFSPVRPR